jgi:hypothetical protein
VGSFNSVLLEGETNDDDTQWWAADPEFDYMRLGACRDPLCAVLCDDVCSCQVRVPDIHEEFRRYAEASDHVFTGVQLSRLETRALWMAPIAHRS